MSTLVANDGSCLLKHKRGMKRVESCAEHNYIIARHFPFPFNVDQDVVKCCHTSVAIPVDRFTCYHAYNLFNSSIIGEKKI